MYVADLTTLSVLEPFRVEAGEMVEGEGMMEGGGVEGEGGGVSESGGALRYLSLTISASAEWPELSSAATTAVQLASPVTFSHSCREKTEKFQLKHHGNKLVTCTHTLL